MPAFLATRGLGRGSSAGFLATSGIGSGQDVVLILPGGGGVSAPGTHFNQAPSVKKKGEPLLLMQALQEDEELLIILKSFVEIIRWH